jgi:5'-methylthioadenosine phosphorylase
MISSSRKTIGIIGGSGLYSIEGISEFEEINVSTPFGDTSGNYLKASIDDLDILFLPRHDKVHRILPSEINYRANLYGFKKLGAEIIISISAVGSMKEHIKPGDMVVVDQFIDKTKATRKHTFFGSGLVAHVSLAEPVCPVLLELIYKASKKYVTVHKKGTYICIDGPQFSTKAESLVYRSLGVDVIGMTACPEYKLARELELNYAVLALSTDYDCWKEDEAHVDAHSVMKIVKQNVANSKKILKDLIPMVSSNWSDLMSSPCKKALENAIVTRREFIPEKTLETLAIFIKEKE